MRCISGSDVEGSVSTVHPDTGSAGSGNRAVALERDSTGIVPSHPAWSKRDGRRTTCDMNGQSRPRERTTLRNTPRR